MTIPVVSSTVCGSYSARGNLNNAFLNPRGFWRQTIMLIEKFILPLKEPGKILQIIKEFCSVQPVSTTSGADGRMPASPEAWSHKELRTNFRDQPPNSGPMAFQTED